MNAQAQATQFPKFSKDSKLETGFATAQTTGLTGVVLQDIHVTRRGRHVKAG